MTLNQSRYPYIIAEMSGNHGNSLERALKLVKAAHDSGADAIKIQSFTAESMTIDSRNSEFVISNKESPWYGYSLFDLYKESSMPKEWHESIFTCARSLGIEPFSSPFDFEAVDLLQSLNCQIYKIASFEILDIPLIKYVAKTGKPIILSTGMASLSEINDAVTAARAEGCSDLTLLKCTSTYPTLPIYSNLATIPHLAACFNTRVGLSDHSLGVAIPIASVALGAVVIEKHLTLSHDDQTVDSFFSLDPIEFKQMVQGCKAAFDALGDVHYGPTEPESSSIHRRRSLYFTSDLLPGDRLKPADIRSVRPGLGLPPKYFDNVVGLTLSKSVKRGMPLSWDVFRDSSPK